MSHKHDEKPPQRQNPVKLFTAFHTPGPRWPGALRATLALLIPGGIALLLGYETEMLLIAAGGFTVIYGEGHPYRKRLKVMATAGALLATGAMSGAFIGEVVWGQIASGGSHWWLLLIVVFVTVLATVGTWIQNSLRLPPPGSFFIVMVAGGSTMVARLGLNPVEVGLWALIGVAAGLTLGMLPALLNPHGPEERAVDVLEKSVQDFPQSPQQVVAKNHQAETALSNAWFALSDAGVLAGGQVRKPSQTDLVARVQRAHTRLAILNTRVQGTSMGDAADSPHYLDLSRTAIPHARPSITYRFYRSASPHSHATITAGKVMVSALLMGVVGLAFGLGRPDWAIVSGLLVLQWGPDRIPGTIRGLHRVVGSIIGIGLYAVLHLIGVQGWSLLIALAICQFFAEVFVVRNYALCVIFTTPLALLMGNAVTEPLGEIVISRTAEVLLSIVFSLLLLWFFVPQADQKHHARLIRRTQDAMAGLLGRIHITKPADALAERRDLQFELLSERRAAQSRAANDPDASDTSWEDHLRIQRAGYTLLDFCTTNANRSTTLEEVDQLSVMIRDVTLNLDTGKMNPTESAAQSPAEPASDPTPPHPHQPDPAPSSEIASADDRGSAAAP